MHSKRVCCRYGKLSMKGEIWFGAFWKASSHGDSPGDLYGRTSGVREPSANHRQIARIPIAIGTDNDEVKSAIDPTNL